LTLDEIVPIVPIALFYYLYIIYLAIQKKKWGYERVHLKKGCCGCYISCAMVLIRNGEGDGEGEGLLIPKYCYPTLENLCFVLRRITYSRTKMEALINYNN
jgi:hypothetical protein